MKVMCFRKYDIRPATIVEFVSFREMKSTGMTINHKELFKVDTIIIEEQVSTGFIEHQFNNCYLYYLDKYKFCILNIKIPKK